MTPEEFRRAGHELIDWIADYRKRIYAGQSRVMPETKPGAVRERLPKSPPERGEPFESLLRDIDQIIEPACFHWQNPNFYGWFPSNGSLSSVLGDYLSTGLAQIGLTWQSSPALTEVEEVVTDWLRQMVGLSTEWQGTIHDTASTASLVALICARERSSDQCALRGGMQSVPQPLVVYHSAESNSSIEKAALLAGFGRDNLRPIATDAEHALRADLLADAMARDVRESRRPCALIATTGSTATTALDPVAQMAELARKHGAWLHVDAAMAGSAMICPELRWMWQGIEGADSMVLNPHKWLGAAFDCSAYYVRDVGQLIRVMSSSASYLKTAADSQVKNYRDWGIPLGRRFRALKLWFLIREQGVEGLQRRIRRDIENAAWLAAQVDAAPEWRRLNPAKLQTVCLRHEPPGLTGEALDRHTLAWATRINVSGKAYLTTAQVHGRWLARVSIGAEATERHHVEELWTLMRAEAGRAE
jgi:aromatic-L-amino-acid decarboxylase